MAVNNAHSLPAANGRLGQQIAAVLTEKLSPLHLEILDESHQHSRRTADHPETHFKVVIVAEAFRGLSRVKRQQLVYGALGDLMNPKTRNGLHALSQMTFTPEEWAQGPEVTASPVCSNKPNK